MQQQGLEGWAGLPPWEEACAVFDGRGRLEVADPGFLSLLGHPRLSPDPDAPEAFWLAHGFTSAGPEGPWAKDGRLFQGHVRKVQDHTLVRLEDITDQVDARRQRRKFLSVAAHDLRGPLANVRSYTSLLLSPRLGLDERTQRALHVMGRNADRALRLVDALFDLWKDELGALPLEPEVQALQPLLEEAEGRARLLADERGVRVDTDYTAPVEPFPLDPDRLRPVLEAFWSTVLERSGAGQAIGSALRQTEGWVALTFWDSGAPLSGEQMAHAFDRDYVVAEARRLDARFELCVAGAFVRAHGGTLAVSREAERTLFSFTLPKAPPMAAPEAGPPPS